MIKQNIKKIKYANHWDLKLFVVVRNDLSRSQKAVQAIHASAEYLQNENTQWQNGVVVLLKVSNEKELKELKYKLDKEETGVKCFFEPDLNDSMTAIAVVCHKDVEYFKDLPLL